MQVKTTMRYHLTPVRVGTFKGKKRTEITRCWWWECAEMGILVHCWWECKKNKQKLLGVGGENVQKWESLYTVESSMVVPQNIKNRTSIWSSNSTSGYKPKELKAGSQRDICISVFIAALFTTANTWNQSKSSSANERISKMWYIHTMEYILAYKGRKFWHRLPHGWTLRTLS